jgi:hypothetical protein
MYTIRMRASRTPGRDTATMDWNGHHLIANTRNGCCMALARVALAAGAPDGPWVGVDYLTGAECLHGPSLRLLAGLTVREDDRLGPIQVKWRPFEHPAKQAGVA